MAVRAGRDTGRLAGWTALIGVFSALSYYGRYSADAETADDPLYRWSSAISGAVQFAIFMGFVFLLARGRSLRDVLALRRPTSWGVAAGIAGGLIVLLWVITLAIQPFLDPGEEQGLLPDGWDPSRAAPFAANFFVVVLFAPIVEELLFRGVGYTLLRPFGRWFAILGTAVAFALAHGLIEGFPVLVFFGAGLAYLRSRTDSVVPGIILHSAFNAFVLLASVRFFTEAEETAQLATAFLRTVW